MKTEKRVGVTFHSTTTKLALAGLKTKRSRTVLITISIMLTTMLLTIIALSGYALAQSNRANAGLTYGEHYGAFTGVSDEIYQKVKAHAEFYEVGKMESFAAVSLADADGVLSFRDTVARELSHAETEEGSFPEQANEIAGQIGFFRHAGYENPKIGDTVSLTYRVGDQAFETSEFVICGLLAEYEANELRKSYGAYVSEAFYEQAVPKEERSYSVVFKVRGEEKLNQAEMAEKIKALAEDLGLEERQVVVNNSYLMWQLDPGTETIAICLVIAAIVVLFAALVIYNIFYVDMIQRVQEYGKLRAIGTTKKQIRQMLFKEGMILAGIGTAAGLLLGYAASSIFFQWLFQRMYADISVVRVQTVSVWNLPLLLLAAAASFATVLLSLLKPMRIASGVSPVEAMRYQEEQRKGKGIRKGYRTLEVRRLTFANLSRNKKRTLTTILTMGLSCVLFVAVANVAGNMDAGYAARGEVEKGDFFIALDVALNDTAYPERNLNRVQQLNLMSEEWLAQIRGIDGVTGVETRNAVLVRRENMAGEEDEPFFTVTVYSEEDYRNLEALQGTIDYDRAAENGEIVFGADYWMSTYGYAIGDTVELTFFDGEKEVPVSFTLAGSTEANSYFILTEQQFEEMQLEGDMTTYVWVSCEKKKRSEVEEALNQMISESEFYEMTTYQNAYQVSALAVNLMKGALYALLGIIGVIGFMNMANTLITSIITRRRELGILQAVGMTKRQLSQMLQMEGMVFTAGTLFVALTAGNLCGYLAFLKCKEMHVIGIHTYHIPAAELLIMTAALLLLQTVLSLLLSGYLQKESLVERIRGQE